MSDIKVSPIRSDFLERVRTQNRDDQNQVVRHMQAQGGEPCRDVLRLARPGEALILASYCPFTQPGPYREFGPVFIRAESSPESTDFSRIPVGSHQGQEYLTQQFVLRAYDEFQDIVCASLVSPQTAVPVLKSWFSSNDIAFVDARFAAFGCFACRIVRA